MYYFCCNDSRRQDVQDHPTLNGIDFLEVIDNRTNPYEQRQTTLLVHFVKGLAPGSLATQNIHLEGGERIKNIPVTAVTISAPASPPLSPPTGEEAKILVVKVAQAGDFSTYMLRLVQNADHKEPPDGFDPLLSAVEFSFKVACESDFDCKPRPNACAQEPVPAPQINYLAKDYASFRQLMLDRLALLSPSWQERNPADLGVTLVELLAYIGDYLSYQQDAVATEAYLRTARKRVSVRRHARLVDYLMHDGCNARTWVHVEVAEKAAGLALQKMNEGYITKFLTRVSELPTVLPLDSAHYQKGLGARAQVFELMHDAMLHHAHNEMRFYTWGARECCLPQGATRATLSGHFPKLDLGQVLILAEVIGPQTGVPADADPAHRHPVRLTKVTLSQDLLYPQSPDSPPLASPPDGSATPVTEIEWHPADALPFPLCVSSRRGTDYFQDVSVARGNIVLADHGLTIRDEEESSLYPDKAPEAKLTLASSASNQCEEATAVPVAPRFRPQLRQGPLTQATAYDKDNPPVSASAVMRWTMRSPVPCICLEEQDVDGVPNLAAEWCPKRDLLNSGATAKEFVGETESDGITHIRFGDNKQGLRPASGTKFKATYRVGNGSSGNIGAQTLAHLVSNDPVLTGSPQIISVTNLLPAQGGMEPEPVELVRQKAPYAFRQQERAVTPADYEMVAQRCDARVQRAACTFRWTGSWRTAFLTVDRIGGQEVDAAFEKEMRSCLERYRMAGYDLEVDGPRYVSLEIKMSICVKTDYFASDVKAALLERFSNRILPDGRRGIFHPDNFTFGQPVYLSPLYAAAQVTPGVSSVQITKFRRQGDPASEALEAGKLLLGRLEIARLDNDPNFAEQGIFNLIMEGGRR